MAKAAKAAPKKAAVKKALTKSQLVGQLADKTGLSKKDVEKVLGAIVDSVTEQLGTKGPGKFVFPGLARMSLSRVAERKGGEVKKNPLNGKEYTTKPRAAFNKVNIRPIKAIKTTLA